VHRLVLATLAAAVVVVVMPAAAQEREGGVSTLAAFRGSVMAVAQDAHTVAWLQWSPDGCRYRTLARGAKAIRSVKYATTCGPYFHDLVLAGGRAVWAGDDEVICGKGYATVNVIAGGRPRLVQKIPKNCLGFGLALRGLATDGRSFYYNVFQTLQPPAALDCSTSGGPCRWQLGRGHIARVDGTRPVAIPGLPSTVTFAVAAGRVLTVQPLKAVSGGPGGWPRAARNGRVEIHDATTGRLEASFRPEGIVRSAALTRTRAVVLVDLLGLRRLETYDVRTGRRVKSMVAPQSLGRLLLDGNLVAYRLNKQVRVLDIATGRRWVVASTKYVTIGLSIRNGWVVWGENRNKYARIRLARAD
jgi:hypothetical protein